jgi:hypothetical protein
MRANSLPLVFKMNVDLGQKHLIFFLLNRNHAYVLPSQDNYSLLAGFKALLKVLLLPALIPSPGLRNVFLHSGLEQVVEKAGILLCSCSQLYFTHSIFYSPYT